MLNCLLLLSLSLSIRKALRLPRNSSHEDAGNGSHLRLPWEENLSQVFLVILWGHPFVFLYWSVGANPLVHVQHNTRGEPTGIGWLLFVSSKFHGSQRWNHDGTTMEPQPEFTSKPLREVPPHSHCFRLPRCRDRMVSSTLGDFIQSFAKLWWI